MLLFLTALLLWLPALGGWALPWVALRQRLGGPGRGHFDGGDGVAGLAALAALSVLLNFAVPLSTWVSGLALVAGWLLLAVRLYRVRLGRPSVRLGLLALAWLIATALLANVPPDNYDSGLYHLQSLLWAHASAVPLGLANLHGRFGFNSTATPLAALLQLPLWGQTTNTSPNVLGALLLCIFGAELLGALRRPGLRLTRTTLFLALGAVVLWSVLHFIAVNSPTSDWPILVLTLLSVALALRAFDDPAAGREAIAGTLLIALFAITVKLSALPLFGLPAALALYAARQRLPLSRRPLLELVASVGLALVLPWAGRGVVLSGCLAYPVAVTCFSSLPWSVPIYKVEDEARWVISWARMPGPNLAITLHGWGWLPAWVSQLNVNPAFPISLLLLVGGVIVWAAVRHSPTAQADRWAALVIGAPLLVSLAYWFVTAPDIRFAAGTFWSLGLLSVSLAYHRLAQSTQRGRRANLFRVASLQLCALILVGNAALMSLRALVYLSQAGPSAYLLAWPAVKPIDTIIQTTRHGDAVRVPTASDQCWLAPLPCTPYFNDALVIEQDSSGTPRQLSIPRPP